jgi:hypothetical protein
LGIFKFANAGMTLCRPVMLEEAVKRLMQLSSKAMTTTAYWV